MDIIFAGTPEFAAISLRTLIEAGHRIIAVYTQPDRPAGRGKKLLASEVKQLALEHKIPVYQPLNFKDPEALETLHALEADLMIVAAYGIILPAAVLNAPRLGCINIHASLLPRWRGAAPIQRAIQAGDETTGITIMQMDEGLDTGAMLLKREIQIDAQATGGSLHDQLAELGGTAIVSALELLAEGKLKSENQDNEQACYAKKLSKQEAQIDWSGDATQIARNVRAFNPWPVAFFLAEGERIRVFEARALEDHHESPPGTIIDRSREGIRISCGKGTLSLQKIQFPGGKALSVKDVINGGKAGLEAGTRLDP